MNTPVLRTKRLVLRPFALEDAREVLDCWESDPDVARYMFWSSHNDIRRTESWVREEVGKIAADDWYRWEAVSRQSGALMGTGLLYLEDTSGIYEVAYNLGKAFWGKGYMTEAMEEILRFASESLKLEEVVGRHAAENPASGRVLEKLGFTFVREIPYPCGEDGQERVYTGREYIRRL